MAHIEKYQGSALGNMCAHYERKPELERGYKRENIDPTRTEQNYNLAPNHGNGQVAFINERIETLNLKRKPRKDAVRMCDCVITMPQSLDPALRDEFFAAAYEELAAKFGAENVVSAWVHLDESQPHMHFAWVPVTKDGRLCAKEVVSKPVLQRLHTDLQENIERALGVPVEVVLDEKTRGDRAAKYVDMPEFKAATERLEYLRREVAEKELEPASETLSESARALLKGRGDEKREQGLREANESLRVRIKVLEEKVWREKQAVRAIEARVDDLRTSLAAVKEDFTQLFHSFKEKHPHIRKITDIPANVADVFRGLGFEVSIEKPRERSQEKHREQQPSLLSRSGPALDLAAAREAARAYNRDYGHSAPSRGRSR